MFSFRRILFVAPLALIFSSGIAFAQKGGGHAGGGHPGGSMGAHPGGVHMGGAHPGGLPAGGYHPVGGYHPNYGGGYYGGYRPYYGSGLVIGLGGYGLGGYGLGYGGYGGYGYGGYPYVNGGYYGGTSSSGYYSPSYISPTPVTPPTYATQTFPQSQDVTTDAGPATLTVVTIEGALVWFDGTASDQKGTIHTLTTAVIDVGQTKTVTVKVVGPSGSPASVPLRLKGGDKTTVDLSSIR